MRKIIEIGKGELLEEFLSIFGIGLIDCFQKGVLDYDRISKWFYNIYTISYAHVNGFSKEFKRATGLGDEIYAVMDYFVEEDPNGETSTAEIFDLFQTVIKKSIKKPVNYGYTFLHIDDMLETPKWYEEMEERKRIARENWQKMMDDRKINALKKD